MTPTWWLLVWWGFCAVAGFRSGLPPSSRPSWPPPSWCCHCLSCSCFSLLFLEARHHCRRLGSCWRSGGGETRRKKRLQLHATYFCYCRIPFTLLCSGIFLSKMIPTTTGTSFHLQNTCVIQRHSTHTKKKSHNHRCQESWWKTPSNHTKSAKFMKSVCDNFPYAIECCHLAIRWNGKCLSSFNKSFQFYKNYRFCHDGPDILQMNGLIFMMCRERSSQRRWLDNYAYWLLYRLFDAGSYGLTGKPL